MSRLGGKSVRRGGASNDSRGGCAPQNEDGGTAREDSRPTKSHQIKPQNPNEFDKIKVN